LISSYHEEPNGLFVAIAVKLKAQDAALITCKESKFLAVWLSRLHSLSIMIFALSTVQKKGARVETDQVRLIYI